MDRELELKKLQNEELSIKNDRAKIIADTFKVIFSAGFISLATVFINNEYQERQLELDRAEKKNALELARIEKENEFIRQFVKDISDESIEVKKEITRYFSILLPDGESKASERWAKYGAYIDQLISERNKLEQKNEAKSREYNELQVSLAKAERELASLKSKGTYESGELEAAIDAKKSLENKLTAAIDDIDRYRQEIESINYVKAKAEEALATDDVVTTKKQPKNLAESLWSFVGTYRNDVYVELPYFEVERIPQEGDVIAATTDVSRRVREPRYSLVRGWTLGEKKDVVANGQKLTVDEVALIPAKGGGYRVWVKGALKL